MLRLGSFIIYIHKQIVQQEKSLALSTFWVREGIVYHFIYIPAVDINRQCLIFNIIHHNLSIISYENVAQTFLTKLREIYTTTLV